MDTTVETKPEARPMPLRSLIAAELPSLVALRHDLHRHPELSFQEHRTAGVVRAALDALGISYKAGLARGTGIVAHLPATEAGGEARPAVALRADMDALPIDERTGRAHASTTPGVMHACGHDGHTTILIGAARVLSKLERPNPVTLIFQPAEEGGGGGELMCDEGALLGDAGGGIGAPVGRIFGLHGWPSQTVGTVATRAGPLLASTDDFEVVVRGHGGHAAYPHLCRDPIVAASAVVTALQTLVSRCAPPLEPAVCTVGQISAGTANNIIPETATLIGTVRSLTPETRALLKTRFFELVERTCASHGCVAEIAWHAGYPVTVNDASLAAHFGEVARRGLGDDRVLPPPPPTMGGEDFAYYGRHVPACFFLLGLKPPGAGVTPQLHEATFDFNDEALPTGIEMMCRLALAR